MTERWPMVGRDGELELFRASVFRRDQDAFILTGPAGVGKTRLADECMAWAAREGMPVTRAAASRTMADVPFGALAHLLAPPTTGVSGAGSSATATRLRDGTGRYSWFRQALRHRACGRRLMLFIDDLNLLDAQSMTLLTRLTEAGEVFLTATMRHGEPVPDDARRIWSGDRTLRVELSGLDRDGVSTLVSLALGGPVTTDTSAALWQASRGNILFLRELVSGALEERSLVVADGIWRLKGTPMPTSRLKELVDARMATLEPKARTVMEHLAVCEPLGTSMLNALASPGTLEQLERSGLIEKRADGRRQLVGLAHPLYAEAIRSRLSRLTVDRILRDQIDQLRRVGARRADDALRLTVWQLDGSGRADPAPLLSAARLSRSAGDFPQVERLARAALATGGDATLNARAATSLGEALAHLGRVAESEEVFESADALKAGDDRRAAVVLRTLNLFWARTRPEDALALLDRCRAASGGRHDDDLVAARALALTLCHRPREAYELLASAPGGPNGLRGPSGELARVAVFAALGRAGDALAASDAASESEPLATGSALTPVLLVYGRGMALFSAGRLTDAIATAERGLEQAITQGVTTAHTAFTHLLGRCHLAAGRPRSAIRWFRETAAVARAQSMAGRLQLAHAGLAMAHACLGDEGASCEAVAEMGPPASETQGLPTQARAWSLAVSGDTAGAIERLLAAADALENGGQLVLCADLLHDVARLGEPELVADRLKKTDVAGESAMVTARSLYAIGAAHSDAAVLERASAAFESLGALLYAAEAAAQAHRWLIDARKRAAAAARVRALLRKCEGALTRPLLAFHAPVPLSTRERDVCSLAAKGMVSRDIAARLRLSVRTVDNYLQRAYTKLGISRRTELAAALGPDKGREWVVRPEAG
ncbi:AAA family ATPase [Microtetraspora fusca]|uniref:AAA family ATPase n=1 Tax=Microtetraspora fusca TaxID=1997 RepID=A0ABW6VCN9_MICFU